MPRPTWIRYSSVLFGLALGYIVIARFRAARDQAHDLMVNLALRVSEKEQELALGYARLDQLRREHERTAERTRILHDMNEGVGSHLSAAIREIEAGTPDQGQVLQSLRESLDHLKLSIDAINLPPGDVTALLAEPALSAGAEICRVERGVAVACGRAEPVSRTRRPAMRHLQFMVFEALSNVLKHAQAKVLRIEARPVEIGAQLRIIDDGLGFDVDKPLLEGMLSMRERAAAIGATLSLASQPGRTIIEIVLPYDAAQRG